MTVPSVSKMYAGLTKNDYIRALTSRHPVSDVFLDAVMPTIDAIFRNVPEEMSRSLANFAEETFRRRSEAEAQLKSLPGTYAPQESHATEISRRSTPVRKRDKKRPVGQKSHSRAS